MLTLLFSSISKAGDYTNQESVLDTAEESEVEDDGVNDVIYGEEDGATESGTDDDDDDEEEMEN